MSKKVSFVDELQRGILYQGKLNKIYGWMLVKCLLELCKIN